MSKYKILNSAGITAAIGLASLPAFLTLAPIFKPAAANAEPKTLGAAATVVPNLSLSADNLSITMTPTGSGSIFKTGSIDATVSTNNETGYTLYFSDKDFDNSLKHKNLSGHAIASTASAATGSDMLPNTWGYTLSDSVVAESESESNNATNLALSYEPIPTDYAAIKTTDSQTSGDISKLTFGVKIDNSIPSGVYSDEVLISAVINYSNTGYDQSKLWLDENGAQITTMQQMTYDICESVPTPTITATGSNVPEITLTDTRDGNEYTVKKLADGNCWMTESLKIADADIEPTKSNITAEVLTAASTEDGATASGFEEAGKFKLPEAVAFTETTNSTTAPMISNGGMNDTYLYNWYAATAGTGKSDMTSEDAPGDICPKGWQLPSYKGNMSWYKLLHAGQGVYEIAISGRYSNNKVAWGTYDENGVGIKTAAGNPLGLQHTGYFWQSLRHNLHHGYYLTRTAGSEASKIEMLDYWDNYIMLEAGGSKISGYAVRCVAKGTDGVTPETATYMQDVEACPASLPLEQKYTLKDKRDNKEYTVARLADGNCWMTSNLAIEDQELEPTMSNVMTNFTLPKTVPAASTTASYTSAVMTNEGVDGTYLYNWFAATAGSGTQSLSFDENASQDICPKGWQLPNGDGDKSWNRLLREGEGAYEIATSDNKYSAVKVAWGKFVGGIETVSTNPLGLQTTNYFSEGVSDSPTSGYYWTRTAISNTNVRYLHFSADGIMPRNNRNRRHGLAVRCVLK